MTNGVEVNIVADENGILVARFPDGSASTILVDIYGSPYYGFLHVKQPKQEVESDA